MKQVNLFLKIIVLIFLLFIINSIASAENGISIGTTSGTCGDGVTWIYNDGELIIDGSGSMTNFTKDNVPWEVSKPNIQSIVIRTGVTNVGNYAFYDCANLQTVSLPISLRVVGYSSFERCYSLTSIVLPEGLTTIDNFAFRSSGLENITWPSTINSIGLQSFGYTNLESVTIPNTITYLGNSAFSFCYKLKSIVFQGSGTVIPAYALDNCTSLEEVSITEGYETISSNAFFSCSKLKTVHLPLSIKNIESNAFDYCELLENVYYNGSKWDVELVKIGTGNTKLTRASWYYGIIIPEPEDSSLTVLYLPTDLKTIESQAFSKTKFQKIIIPPYVEEIETGAFSYCSELLYLQLTSDQTILRNDMFTGSNRFVVICPNNSAAAQWAIENGYPVILK